MMLLWLCILWVLAASVVALMPMRYQYAPGIGLLLAAPLLIFWIGYTVALWAALLALCAFVSMFRNPLRYFWARARGLQPEAPE
ncbi:DUF2484 family protein [Roseobacter weihaiensis]|uniref:DUF2484 family protein n=1 Tax=Roseobacter weihaiensis TaxID=2763262 RepID=UPI001D0AE079|nr:DUF2484 family protein [Roseobacter sp. H9]